jgi:hypothetical protein
MTLSMEQMKVIILDYTYKREPRVKGEEAEKFLEEYKKDEAFAKEKGWMIELPFEIAKTEIK